MVEPATHGSQDRSDEIRRLCAAWREATAQPGGGLAITPQIEQNFRLRNNGIEMSSLSHTELRAVAVGLTTVLLLPGMNAVIDQDHLFFWSWCGDLLAGPHWTYFGKDNSEDHELRELLSLAVRATLSSGAATADPDALLAMNVHLRELAIHGPSQILTYLSFPLLEGILKKECRRYVDQDGTVLQAFEVPGAPGKSPVKYVTDTSGDKGRTECSSLRDLLWLLHDYVASPELKSDLDAISGHIRGSFAKPSEGGFGVLYRWRNSSAHGSESLQTVGGTVLSISLVIAIHALVNEYEGVRVQLVSLIARDLAAWQKGQPRPTWSFYPP
jgi:hypothetical protein